MFVVLLSFTNMLLSGNTSSSLLQFPLYNHYPQPLCLAGRQDLIPPSVKRSFAYLTLGGKFSYCLWSLPGCPKP